MAEQDPRRCSYFFLYDGSKVRGEGDLTREGISYFYPEETPLDQQELICGQLAGVGRCVSELSSSPVRVLRLRRLKFAVRASDDLFWALGCPADVPSVSVCQTLDRLIGLFCFYNGAVSLSYQLHSREVLAARWARYLSHLQSGSTDLHRVFSCLKTIDSTNVDPLLLLKAALILQACQRCPLVLGGCILFRGRVVSTQMFPELTMKVMVHEDETYLKAQREGGASSSGSTTAAAAGGVGSTAVFLTPSELRRLRTSAPRDSPPSKPRLSRTLSDPQDTPSSSPPPPAPLSNGRRVEEVGPRFQSGGGGGAAEAPPPCDGEGPLVPMALYLHRVKGLVLVLLVEPRFLDDSASMEEVYHSSLASLNGLEAHLRTAAPPGAPGPPGLYSFAHFDSIQSTLTTNLSPRGGAGGPERPFVRAASLLHSHFCAAETLQEVIIRNAGAAVYGARTVAQETYFQQHGGGALRNSGVPNHQDSAFSLPAKARHRLQKHGLNLL